MLLPAHRRPRPGNVIPIVAILAVFLVGMVAFAIDTNNKPGNFGSLSYGVYSPPRLVIP